MATLSIVDASGAFAALGVYAIGFSTLRFEITDYNSACDGYYFYLDGVEYRNYPGGLINKTKPWLTLPYYEWGLCNLSVGAHSLRVLAFDGDVFNPTVTYHDITITFRVANYNAPAISLFSAKRCTSGGVDADDGTYVKYSLVASVNPANDGLMDNNSPLFRVRYKASGTTTWSYTTIESGVFVIAHTDVVLNLGLSAGQTFDFEAYVTDKWKSATAATLLPKDNVPFSWADGRFAIGKVTTQDGFDCDFPAEFRKSVKFNAAPEYVNRSAALEKLTPFCLMDNPATAAFAYNSTTRHYMFNWQTIRKTSDFNVLKGGPSNAMSVGVVIPETGIYEIVFNVAMSRASANSGIGMHILRMPASWSPPSTRDYLLDSEWDASVLKRSTILVLPWSTSNTLGTKTTLMYCEAGNKVLGTVYMNQATKDTNAALCDFSVLRVG